jgi:hypothetical protein
MQNNSKKVWNTFASGWLKESQKGQYISATANGEKAKIKLIAQLEDGTTIPLNNFAVYFNTNKDNPNGPDARFVFTT